MLPLQVRLSCWLLVPAVLGAVVVAGYYWSAARQEYSEPEEEPQKVWSGVATGTGEVAHGVAPPASDIPDASTNPEPSSGWKEAKLNCPWPPRADTWRALDERCVATMSRLVRPDWLSAFHDTLRTRRMVVAALDKPECRPPPAQSRPDLHEACAAEAMVRLAVLQNKCVDALRTHWNERLDYELEATLSIDLATGQLRLGTHPPYSQQEHYRRVELHNRFAAEALWRTHLCDSVPATALDWIDALPIPLDHQSRPPFDDFPTQAPDLVEAARRLGASIPSSALPPFKAIGDRPRRLPSD